MGSGSGIGKGKGDDIGEGVAAGGAVACVCMVVIWTFGLPILLAGITLMAVFDDGDLRTAGVICVAIACVMVGLGVILTIVTCVCGAKLKTTRNQTQPTTIVTGGAATTTIVTGQTVGQPQTINPYGTAPPPYSLQPAYGYQQQPGHNPSTNPYSQPYNPYTTTSQQMVNPYAQTHNQQNSSLGERPPEYNPHLPPPVKA